MPALAETDFVACEKFGQSGPVRCHRLRIARSEVIADVLKQRDTNLAIVVIGAVGNAVRHRRMVVDGLRPLLGDGMRPTRDGTGRADLR